MGFFSNIAKGFGFGGSSNTGRRAAEQIKIANAKARKEIEKQFGTGEANFTAAQRQIRDDFLRERGLLEEQFRPVIEAGGRALERVEVGGTVGGLDATIAEILGTGAFQTLNEQQRQDLLFQQTGSGLRRGDALEEFANLSPGIAFGLERELFGRNRDLANLGFQGVERRGQLGSGLTLGQGGLSTGLTSLEEQLRAQFSGRVSDLITGTGKAASSGILADQQINQQRIQNLINLVSAVTGGGGGSAPSLPGSKSPGSSLSAPRFGSSGAIPGGISGIGEPLRGPSGRFFNTGSVGTGTRNF